MEINSTTNYDQFKFIEANREQARGHIENIKKAFEEYGNLTKVQPILVNEKFEIIDGQHRFVACRDLGEPIYYTQVEGLNVEDARSMNILHKGWGPLDYAKSYATQGDPNYQKYLNLREDYGFGHMTTLFYALGSIPKGTGKVFRSGEFVIPDEVSARERLDKLAEVGTIVPFITDEKFTRAFIQVIITEGYDHKRMLRKLKLHQHIVERKGTIEDYLRMLEDVYNFQMPPENRLRLY